MRTHMKSFQKSQKSANLKSELLATYRAIEFIRPYFSQDAIAILDIHWKFRSVPSNADLATILDA
jgi:hypothetical protein